MRGVVDSVSSAATEMQSTAQSMSLIVDKSTQQTMTVSTASEQASNNVQTVAAAAEQLSASITEIGRQVREAGTLTEGCRARGGRRRKECRWVKGLVGGNRQRREPDLGHRQADQFAGAQRHHRGRARGDAGRGFAVVASEVKALSSATQNATEDISQQIGSLRGATAAAVAAVGAICPTLEVVAHVAVSVASAIEEQIAATQEIARNVQQAADRTGEVSRNISGVTQQHRRTGCARRGRPADRLRQFNWSAEVDPFRRASGPPSLSHRNHRIGFDQVGALHDAGEIPDHIDYRRL